MRMLNVFYILSLILSLGTGCRQIKSLTSQDSSEPELKIIIDYRGSQSFEAARDLHISLMAHVEDGDPMPVDSLNFPIRELPTAFRVKKKDIKADNFFTVYASMDGFSVIPQQVTADKIQVQILEDISERYSKDGLGIYYLGQLAAGCDPKTFAVINRDFGRDSRQVFAGSDALIGADPKSFQVLNEVYQKDAQNVYCDKKILASDVTSIEVLSFEPYAKDSSKVFFYCEVIAGADRNSFTSLSRFAGKDARFGYYNGKQIADSDGPSFRLLDASDVFQVDARSAYSSGLRLPVADPTKFRVLTLNADQKPVSPAYATDDIKVFFHSTQITQADAASFQVVDEYQSYGGRHHRAKDKLNEYEDDRIVGSSSFK